ncbi:DMT family transporter [Caloramator sp. E03]|uniref:DMT family transporter n=1 Tax=Caloramator sp. E03 TaxID=2576307 RepID=UPI001110E87D|nr:DMT family transporter [Caloramator sp. E03]QCX34873.1 DMT family transporter [Caloramator sp. E03]
MLGIIFSAIAGALMSMQGVFNTRASEKMGLWEINVFVQGTGFLITLIVFFIFGNGNIKRISEINKLYLTGGLIGVFIIFTVMKGMKMLSPTYAVSIILITQLITAAIIDCCGLFETKKLVFHFSKILGVIIMIIGIIIFKWKG